MDRDTHFEQYLAELADNPNDLGPLKRLEYNHVSDWGEFVWTLESKASEIDDAAAASRLYLEAGRSAIVYLDDDEWAERLLEQAIGAGSGTALEREARLFQVALDGDEEELLGYFTEALEQAENNVDRARLYLRMGAILEHLYGNVDEADNAYMYALELQGSNLPAMWARERVARRREDWDALGRLLEEEIELADEPGRQVELSVELGELYRDQLANQEAAVECFGFAYELDPSNERARTGLVELGELEQDDLVDGAEMGGEALADSDSTVDLEDLSEIADESEPDIISTPSAPEPQSRDEADLEDDDIEFVDAEDIEQEADEEELDDEEIEFVDDQDVEAEADVEAEFDGEDVEIVDADAVEEQPVDEQAADEEALEDEEIEFVDADAVDEEAADEEALEDEEIEFVDAEDVEEDAPDDAELDDDDIEFVDAEDVEEDGDDAGGPEQAPPGPPPMETPGEEPEAVDAEGEAVDEDEEVVDLTEVSESDDVDVAEAEDVDGAVDEEDGEEEEVVDLTEVSESDDVDVVEDEDADGAVDEEDGQEVVDLTEVSEPEDEFEEEAELEGEADEDAEEFAAEEVEAEADQQLEEDTEDEEVEDASVEDEEHTEEQVGDGGEDEDAEEPAVAAASTTRAWDERFLEFREAAMEADSADAAVTNLVEAARLEWLNRADDEADTSLWRDVLETGAAEDFWTRTHHLRSAETYWSDVMELLEESEAPEALCARVALYDLGDRERGAELAESAGDEELIEAAEDLAEAEDNWRRFQRGLEKEYRDRSKKEKAEIVYNYLADLARGLGERSKEIDALRRLDRQVDDPLVSDRLMVCYREAGKWPMYVDLVKERAEAMDEARVADRVDWLKEAVRIYRDEMNHDMMVVNTYRDILEADPENVGALDALIELYDDMNRSSELINALQEKAELVEDADEQIALYTRIAELFLDKFRNQAEAITAYEKVLEIDPYHDQALQLLQEMYEKRRDWEKLVDVRRRQVEGLEDDDEKVAQLKEVAELATDRLRKPEVATEMWLEVRELAPEDREALDALESLYEKSRDWEALVDILEAKAGRVDDEDALMKLYQKLGKLCSDRLENVDRAIDAWRNALELRPDDRGAQKSLERLYIDNRQWDELEAFYRGRDALRELVRMMETLAGTVDEEPVTIEILVRAGRIWRDDLEETARAQRNLERALDIDPHHEEVARRLEPIYREQEDWEGLRDVLEIVLEHQEDSDGRRECQLQLARLHEEDLEEPGVAFDWYARALGEEPADESVLESLETTAETADCWERLVEVLRDVLDADIDWEITRELRLRLGRVLFDHVERPDQALEQFEAVLEEDQENVRGLAGLESVYEAEGRWDELIDVYQRRLDLTQAPEERVEILHGMARLAEQQKGDLEEAVERLNEALELQPDNTETLAELHRLYRSSERYEELVEIIDRQIELVEARAAERVEDEAVDELVDPAIVFGEAVDSVEDAGGEAPAVERRYTEADVEQLVELRFELGMVLQTYLERDADAIDALQTVVAWRPDHTDARLALEGYLEDEVEALRVAEILEPVYEIHGQWHDLVDALEIQVDEATVDEDAVVLLERIGGIFVEETGEAERAFDAYGRLLRRQPDHEGARRQLRRIADQIDIWQRLADLYEEVVDRVEDEELRVSYFFELGDVWADQLEEPALAENYYRDVLALRPESERALEALEVVCSRTEQWESLLEVYEQKLELLDGEEAEALRFQMAALLDRQLERPHAAIDVLEEVFEHNPESLEAVRALNELLEANEMWEELADSVARELELVEAEAKNAVKKRLASIHHEHLGDEGRAVDLYEAVIDDDAEDAQAVAALEELMDAEVEPAARISRILEPLYVERENWDNLIWALEVQVEHTEEPAQKVELLHRIAELEEREREDRAAAFETQARALREDLEDEATLDALYRLAETEERWADLVAVFREEADAHPDPELRRDLLRRAADVYVDEMDEPRSATPLLHEILELFPADLETAETLEELYSDLEDWEALVDILRHRSTHEEDEETRKELLYQAGNILDEILERPEDAVEVYREVLELDAYDARAIDRLQELYSRLEWWNELLEVYNKKLEMTDQPEARKDLLYAIAPIYEEQLDEPYQAIETYRDILGLDDQELAALENLAHLYEATEQWHELLEALEDQRELVSLPDEKQALHYEIGRLWEGQLGDVHQAVDVYREILDEAPDHEPTREALAGLVERGEAEAEAAEVLHPIYAESGEWAKLVEVKQLLVDASTDPERKLELYREIADIYEGEIGDPTEAFHSYLGGLEVEPTREAFLDEAERLADQLDGWNQYIDTLDAILADTSDFRAVVELSRRIGRVLDEELGDAVGAIDRYERALEAEPEHGEVLEALDRLYQEEERWEDLAETLRTRAYVEEEPAEKLDLRSRLGLVFQNALERPQEAVDVFQGILDDHPDNELAVDSLEQMFTEGEAAERVVSILEPWYRERDRHEKLVELYNKRLERLDDPLERFDLLEQIAELYLGELDEPESALHYYGAALAERPDVESVIDRIAELAAQTESWEEAAGFYYQALEEAEVPEAAAVQLWEQLAEILDTRLDWMDDAEMAYQQVLTIEPGHETALSALDRIYDNQQRHDDLADILRQRLDHTNDADLIIDVEYRLGQLYHYELEDPRRAVDSYEHLLEMDPVHQDALGELETIHRSEEAWEELFDVLERQADATNDPDAQVDNYAQMAMLVEEMLERPHEAVDLWNRVLEIEPNNPDALQELGRLYYQQERWDELVGILERELELADDDEARLALHESLGTVWGEKLQTEGPAIDAWRSVLEIEPTHLDALRALDELYERQGNYAELEGVLERLIDHEQVDEAETLELWERLAEIREDMLVDAAGAIEAWQQVLAEAPEHDEALDHLEALYLQEGQWEEAANVLELKADRVDDEDAEIDLLSRIADLWEHRLEEPERASAFYEQILELDPTDMQASQALEEIYRAQDDEESYSALVGLYVERAEVLDDQPHERLEAMRSAARVLEQHLGNTVHAQMVLLEAFGPETLDDEQLRSDIVRLAEETGQWDEVVEVFEAVVRELGETPEGADLHERIGRMYAERLDQPDDAIYHLRRALDIEPGRAEILEVLQEMYRELEAWPELARVVEDRIEVETDPDVEVELWRNLGELYEIRLEEPEEAVDAYRQILEVDPTDLLALESLERIFEANERWQDLIDVLERKAETTYDPDDVVEIRRRIAETLERRLEDLDGAVDAWHDVLEVEQDNTEALESLERLYFDMEAWDELLDIYRQRLEMTHEPDDQVEIYGRMATVWEDQLGELYEATDAYNQILMVQPENEMALRNLERLYELQEQWFDLVDTLQQHIEIVEEPERRVELLNELARVQRDRAEEPYAAIEAWQRSLELEAGQPNVLFDIAELYEQTGNWQAAIESYRSLVDVLDEEVDRIEIHYTIGQILEHELGNDVEAEEAYWSALKLDAGHTPSREALEVVYERQGDWEGLIEMHIHAAEHTRELAEKAHHLARVGHIYEMELGDRNSALDFYEQALEEDPHSIEAAEPLIDLYMEDEEWERTVPLLQMVIEDYEQADDVPLEDLEDRYVQLARVFEDLQQDEQALEQYWNAYELDRQDVDVLLGLGRLLYETDHYEDAADILEELERDFLGALENDELREVYFKLGKVRQQFGQTDRAVDALEQALDMEPHHVASLEAIVELYEQRGEWERVVEDTRRLLEADDDDDPAVRFARLTTIGEVCADRIGDTDRAIEAYRQALEVKPGSVAVLRKLLEIYRGSDQWHAAVDILERLIEQQDDPARKAKFNYTTGVIYRDKIGDPHAAVEHFQNTLDHNIQKLEAFEAIDRIFTQLKEWKELERAYRSMLRRLAEQDVADMEDIKFKLWEGLGEIYRSRLGHPKSAIQAFETASQLRPQNERIRLILADLYEKSGENPDGAVQQHRRLLENDPFRIDSYKALFRAYLQKEKYDKAWCMSAALDYLQQASQEEQQFFEKYRTQNLRRANPNFDQEAWNLLYHDDQDMVISTIMSVLSQGLREDYADEVKKWGLHPKKDRLDLDQGTLFANVYSYIVETTGIAPVPEVYLKSDQAFGIRNANVHPPGIVAGADVVQNRGARELAFRLGKLLTSMRSEHYLGSLGYPTEFLKMLFMAAMHVTNPNLGLQNQLGESGLAWAEQIQDMPSQMQLQLRKNVSQFLESGENPNLSVWLRHVEHTTNRVGLVMCGDLKQAAQLIKNDRNPISKATPKEKVKELILFSISDEYTRLRRKLGLAID